MTAVTVEREGGALVVTIDRSEARNAVNRAVAEGVAAAMDELDDSDELRVGILTGAGGNFCSGMDLKAFLAGEVPAVEGRGFAGLVERPPKKPLIASVEGYALAGGFELLLACDLVVAAEDAKLGIPEAKRGLVAGAGGLLRLPRQVPRRVAMEWALTGDFVSAARAYEVGLINRVVPPGEALAEAKKLAAAIGRNGPLAVAVSKQVIAESAEWPEEEMWKRQASLIRPVFASEDAREGARAFAEKRAPEWKGR